MEEYIANGVQLGWLIDPINHSVEIYRPGREPEFLNNPTTVSGEGPVDGFVLDLSGNPLRFRFLSILLVLGHAESRRPDSSIRRLR